MIAQLTDTFRMPKDFASLVYLSLLLQAEGIRYGVEHWRRNRNRVSGTLIWQLNDCWPVASWASLDYFGRWKALHYAAKRFYAPLLLSVAEEGKTMKVHVTSDLVEPVDVLVCWRLETLDGKNLDHGKQVLRAMALADTRVGVYDFSTQVSAENLTQSGFCRGAVAGWEFDRSQCHPLCRQQAHRVAQTGFEDAIARGRPDPVRGRICPLPGTFRGTVDRWNGCGL